MQVERGEICFDSPLPGFPESTQQRFIVSSVEPVSENVTDTRTPENIPPE
jgi:hypothetical protein